MRSATEEVQREFVQLWARMSKFWGVSAATARVYAWLMSHPNGGDTDAIMTGLRLGRGTVSMACKELREWGLILSEPVAGARRTRHRVDADLGRVVRNVIEHRKRREWDPILEQLRAWLPRLEADRSPEAAVFRERLRAIEACLAMADAMAQTFLEGGTLDRLDLSQLVQKAAPRRAES